MVHRFSALVGEAEKLAGTKGLNRRRLADTLHCMSRDLRVLAEKIPT